MSTIGPRMTQSPAPLRLARQALLGSTLAFLAYPLNRVPSTMFSIPGSNGVNQHWQEGYFKPIVLGLIFFASIEFSLFYTRAIRQGFGTNRWPPEAMLAAQTWVGSDRFQNWARVAGGLWILFGTFWFIFDAPLVLPASVLPFMFTFKWIQSSIPAPPAEAKYWHNPATLNSELWDQSGSVVVAGAISDADPRLRSQT